MKNSGEGSEQHLSITATGAEPLIKPIHQTVNGQVVGTEVADLSNCAFPPGHSGAARPDAAGG